LRHGAHQANSALQYTAIRILDIRSASVRSWPESEVVPSARQVRSRRSSSRRDDAQPTELLTRMYGAAVRCKRFSSICRLWVLHQCIRPRVGAVVLRAIMDISARAFFLAVRPQVGHSGHQGSHAPGRPVLHLVSSSRRPRREAVVLCHGWLLIGAVPLFAPCCRSLVPACG
jgi:hypothetical protein